MSEVKVNKISPRTNCGTVTLGDSGDTFTIPSGATINNQGTATNFGATGSASWTTTVKTGDFTAVAGEGYFVDTTSQEIDVALPAGTAGAVVAIADYAKNFGTNNVILVQNGSDKIGGSTNNAKLQTDGIAVTLIFIDSTKGWIVTDDGNQSSADTNPFMVATGGTEATSGNCKIHTFTGPGTFCVSKIAACAANNLVSYVVVAGGGGAGGDEGAGGGGAGGFREVESPATPYTASPLDGYPSSPNRVTVTAAAIPITVGAGGAGGIAGPSKTKGDDGSNSVFSTITAAGGGGGGYGNGPSPDTGLHGKPGGSGGGSGGRIGSACTAASVGTGNQPPTSPAQGNPGGAAKTCTSNSADAGGGGGGAGAGGGGASNPTGPGGVGGAGVTSEITASPVARAGGGGGGGNGPTSANGGAGGSGGGGAGGPGSSVGSAGTANTGGGGGGPGTAPAPTAIGGAGGSGIVIIRYKFQ
jgi:hypothetical protein